MASSQAARSSGADATEKRTSPRFEVFQPAVIPVRVDSESNSFLKNVSESGFALQSLKVLKRGTRHKIAYRRPSYENWIECSGSVVWSTGEEAGVRITEIDQSSRETLNLWLNELASIAAAAAPKVDPAMDGDAVPEIARPADEELYVAVARARVLTCANGAAIAWWETSGMICRATTGDAPDLGTPVQLDSGLSGECIRTGQVISCCDTERDARVDPEVCRQLNLRSVVIVPIMLGSRIAGLLEVFSARPNAFTETDSAGLLAIADECAATVTPAPVAALPATVQPAVSTVEVLPEEYRHAFLNRILEVVTIAQRPRYWRIGGAVVVLLAAVAAYFLIASRNASPGPVHKTIAIEQPATTSSDEQPAVTTPDDQPSAPALNSPAKTVAVPPTTRSVPATGRTGGSQLPTQREQALEAPIMVPPPAKLPRAAAAVEVAAPPTTSVAGMARDDMRGLLAGTTRQPVLTVPAESHVSEARVITRVTPVYPAAARIANRQGTVRMRIVVTADGTVKDVRVVSGDGMLAKAAVDAVQRWRYQPATLNGKPVDTESDVVMRFNLNAQ